MFALLNMLGHNMQKPNKQHYADEKLLILFRISENVSQTGISCRFSVRKLST
jgi:hypothetical protein